MTNFIKNRTFQIIFAIAFVGIITYGYTSSSTTEEVTASTDVETVNSELCNLLSLITLVE